MPKSKTVKTLLIIEDKEQWKNTIASLCRRVHHKLYGNGGKIIVVSRERDALAELEKQKSVHFASVDLNLEGDQEATEDPSGLRILKAIKDKGLNTVSIVVSGESYLDFPAISKKYGVLTFQHKNKQHFTLTYLTAVEAALLYVDAKELLEAGKYREALAKWQQATRVVKPIEETIDGTLGDARDWSFPSNIEVEYRARFTHPITHLPTSLLIEDELSQLKSKDEWWLYYIQIKHLEAFIESQGHMQTEVLLKETAALIRKTFSTKTLPQNFIGQTSDNIFVVASPVNRPAAKEIKLIKNAQKSFMELSLPHYDYRSRERRKIEYIDKDGNKQTSPLASLNVGLVKGKKSNFSKIQLNKSGSFDEYDLIEYGDIRQIDEAARQILRQENLMP